MPQSGSALFAMSHKKDARLKRVKRKFYAQLT